VNDLLPLVHITDGEVIGDHELRLTFEDGVVGDVSFDDGDWRGVLSPLRDTSLFAQVRVDEQLGTLVWPGGLDLAPEPLYQQARERRVAHRSPASRSDFTYRP
jgi:Protein of unknown function (DUF2442)